MCTDITGSPDLVVSQWDRPGNNRVQSGTPFRVQGFGDWIGPAATQRRHLTGTCLDAFEQRSYRLIETPLVEAADTVALGLGTSRPDHGQRFSFVDADGTLLSLVAERTVSLARVAATQLRNDPLPLRLCYAGPVALNQPLRNGRRRESLQAGCELIGASGVAADAECVALAATTLSAIGLDDVCIDIGHADFLPGVVDHLDLEEPTRRAIEDALVAHDLVAVEAILESTGRADAETVLLRTFPALRGGVEILDAAAVGLTAPRARRALGELRDLWRELSDHGFADRLYIDLGAVRRWDYYTGPTFEVFSAALGFAVAAGGRYDRLLGRFGMDVAATGFVLHVDRCCDVLRHDDLQHGDQRGDLQHGALQHGDQRGDLHNGDLPRSRR